MTAMYVRPMIAVTATIVILKTRAECSRCLADVKDYREATSCTECKLRFTGICSVYARQASWADVVFDQRPDLDRVEWSQVRAQRDALGIPPA